MKKVIAILFVGSVLTLAACESKPKTEEATINDSTATVVDSSANNLIDSTATAPADNK
jgi:protein involved in sex pheromone biosynthesis